MEHLFENTKPFSRAQYELDLIKQNQQTSSNMKTITEHANYVEEQNQYNKMAPTLEAAERVRQNKNKLAQFSETLKENLLQECFNIVLGKILEVEMATPHEKAIGASMLSKLIKEEGCGELITKFYGRNLILSEFARNVEKYHRYVLELTSDKLSKAPEDDSCFVFDKEIAEKFVDDISDLVPDKTIDLIRNRVSDAMTTFVDQNAENKMAIKDIYSQTKLKVDQTADDTIKQEYTMIAKAEVSKIYNKPCSVFSAMVNAMGEAVLQIPELKQQYTDDKGSIKMEHLCDDTRIMYTVLEIANTLGIIKVDEQYITRVIKDLRNE